MSLNPRCLGRFSISRHMLDEDLGTVALAMCGMVVLEAQYSMDSCAVYYLAISDCFEEVSEGLNAPWYSPILHEVEIPPETPGDPPTIKVLIDEWKKQDDRT